MIEITESPFETHLDSFGDMAGEVTRQGIKEEILAEEEAMVPSNALLVLKEGDFQRIMESVDKRDDAEIGRLVRMYIEDYFEKAFGYELTRPGAWTSED